MARKEERLMGCLIPDPGYVFISADLSAGEPTIITHFSKDPYYTAATFDMVGKAPYYDEHGILMIDDIYLMGMSVSPMGKDIIKGLFELKIFSYPTESLTFAEQWTRNKQPILDLVKSERAFHKILILGLGYSMGPRHMVESAFKAGYELSLQDARNFFKAYWKLFKEVKGLARVLEEQFKRTGYLVNPFGYRLLPDKSYKSLNYFIQSSVSGLINVLITKFFAICSEAKFVTIIHDELICQIPLEKSEEIKKLFFTAVESLNEDLNWDVKVRCGWKEGGSLYEAK